MEGPVGPTVPLPQRPSPQFDLERENIASASCHVTPGVFVRNVTPNSESNRKECLLALHEAQVQLQHCMRNSMREQLAQLEEHHKLVQSIVSENTRRVQLGVEGSVDLHGKSSPEGRVKGTTSNGTMARLAIPSSRANTVTSSASPSTQPLTAGRGHLMAEIRAMLRTRTEIEHLWVGYLRKPVQSSKDMLSRECAVCAALRRFVDSSRFTSLVVLLIILNSIFIAVVSDHKVRAAFISYDDRAEAANVGESSANVLWHDVANLAFTAFFSVELLLRVMAYRLEFCTGPGWRWNVLDLCLVAMSAMELSMASAGYNRNYVRVFRLLRVMRTFRVIRVLRFFRKLRLILTSILHAVVPLVWTIVFILMVLFVFAVISLEGVTEVINDISMDDASAPKMMLYFPNMPTAMLTLFAATSGGISWFEISQLMLQASAAYRAVFVCYVVVMFLMILNIITGLFVTDAVERAQTDKDRMAQQEMERNRKMVTELKALFRELDVDDSGAITLQEFIDCSREQSLKLLFASLGLDITDAIRVFHLLDVDGSEKLELDEFVVGVMSYKGNAKVVDVEVLMRENKRMMQKLRRWLEDAKIDRRAVEDRMLRLLAILEKQSLGAI